MLFTAALNEMRGKKKQFATDPECSIVLERMLHSMDDFVRLYSTVLSVLQVLLEVEADQNLSNESGS